MVFIVVCKCRQKYHRSPSFQFSNSCRLYYFSFVISNHIRWMTQFHFFFRLGYNCRNRWNQGLRIHFMACSLECCQEFHLQRILGIINSNFNKPIKLVFQYPKSILKVALVLIFLLLIYPNIRRLSIQYFPFFNFFKFIIKFL